MSTRNPLFLRVPTPPMAERWERWLEIRARPNCAGKEGTNVPWHCVFGFLGCTVNFR